MAEVSVGLQIVGSESISEATKYAKYVSEFGNEKDSDDEEDSINSRDVFQSFDIWICDSFFQKYGSKIFKL